jgi:Outer membrane cytochrome MtrC/MtrF-like, domains II/IV/Cytochrome c554 and c-prime
MKQAVPNQRRSRRRLYFLLGLLVVAVLFLPASSFYYEYSGGKSCARCHEIWQPYSDWHASSHRNVQCSACHGDVFTLDAGFHLNNLRRLFTHLRGDAPEQVRLRTQDDFRVNERCQTCHRQEWSQWSASLHSATYEEILLDPKQNRKQQLMDDCLRCHGMHFDSGIRDLVTPVNTTGPWRLIHPDLANRPTIPCLTCHQMHRHGVPLARPAAKPTTSVSEEIHPSSVGLFDRRELVHVPVDQLPMPEMYEGTRLVKISPDQRQSLCYQCHAPLATGQVGSGDDRTPIGVHEGLSCFSCHENHGERTRASCAGCHPRLSNCGLDVEKMDTTFKSTASPHNIHFVKCLDCHAKGIPKKKPGSGEARLTASAVR